MARFSSAGGGSGSGAPGPRGPQGIPGQDGTAGADGTDALWNFLGEWVNGVDYAPGSVVEFQGSSYYHPNGQFSSYAPPTNGWLLVAEKGTDGTNGSGGVVYLGNYVLGNGYIADIAVVRGSDNNLYIAKSNGGLHDPVNNTAEWDIFSDNTAGSADIADFTFELLDGEGSLSRMTIANHDMVIQTTRDGEQDADISLNSADDIWINATDDIEIAAANSIYLNAINGVYLGTADEDENNPDNRVATIGDIQQGTTGDITFSGVQIIGAGTAAGDGSGNGTMELVPDVDLTSNQYLIIEPTGPNHIHIRAGGNIDESTADVILGGERNKVAVSDSYKSVAITTAATITNTYVNAHEADNEDLIVPETSDILIGDNIVIAGINHPVTYFSPDPMNTGFSIVRATGVTFVAGGSYTFVREEPYENSWHFGSDGVLSGPSMGGLVVNGLVGTQTDSLVILSPNDDIVINATGGNIILDGGSSDTDVYIGSASLENKVATIGDIDESVANATGNLFQSVRWTPNFTATGLTFTGADTTHPTYNSHYIKQGQLVSFWIAVDCSTVTSFGTGQLNLELPFAPLAGSMNHFSGWVFVDEAANPDLAGHIIVNADHLPNTQTLDLHYIKSAGGANSAVMEAILKQNTPVVLTTATNIYVNGTYIAAF